MPSQPSTPDVPHCPTCDYPLLGLDTAAHCPECGQALPPDRARLLGPPAFGLQRLRLAGLLHARAFVILHPIRACRAADSHRAVATAPLLIFAGAWTALTIYLYAFVKVVGLAISFTVVESPRSGWTILSSHVPHSLNPLYTSFPWEAWAITRWWVFFMALAFAAALLPANRTGPFARLTRRVLVFTPWFALLEIGHLAAVYAMEYNVVPEGSTIFGARLGWAALFTPRPQRMVPTFLVTLVFARAVLGLRWLPAVLVAAVTTPLAIRLCVLWSWLWLWMRN